VIHLDAIWEIIELQNPSPLHMRVNIGRFELIFWSGRVGTRSLDALHCDEWS
jgi:hypothetical protein